MFLQVVIGLPAGDVRGSLLSSDWVINCEACEL